MDIGALKKLGWKPQYTLQNNAEDYIKWLRGGNVPAVKNLKTILKKMEADGVVRRSSTAH